MQFLAQNIWLLVPIQGKIKEFFADVDQFPSQPGSSLNAGGINYGTLRQEAALKRLKELETMTPLTYQRTNSAMRGWPGFRPDHPIAPLSPSRCQRSLRPTRKTRRV